MKIKSFILIQKIKKCVSSCSIYGKYYIEDNPEWINNCKIKGINFYNSDKKCQSNYLFDKNAKFS